MRIAPITFFKFNKVSFKNSQPLKPIVVEEPKPETKPETKEKENKK